MRQYDDANSMICVNTLTKFATFGDEQWTNHKTRTVRFAGEEDTSGKSVGHPRATTHGEIVFAEAAIDGGKRKAFVA